MKSTAEPAAPDIPVAAAELQPADRVPAPRRLTVSARGVDMPVQPVGVLDGGGMRLPDNPSTAGWYRFGPAPASDKGSIVISAHVDSLRWGLGPMARLRDLPTGTRVRVVDTAGTRHVYEVVETERFRKRELPVRRLFDREGPTRLTLITCGGTFDTVSRTYSDNVVIHAEPVG